MLLDLRFSIIYIQFQWSRLSNLSVKYPPFKISCSLVFNFTLPKQTVNDSFTVLQTNIYVNY
jgi:hypothetical protein